MSFAELMFKNLPLAELVKMKCYFWIFGNGFLGNETDDLTSYDGNTMPFGFFFYGFEYF